MNATLSAVMDPDVAMVDKRGLVSGGAQPQLVDPGSPRRVVPA
ncbi:hypothetical protein ACWEKT_38980 [Nocardia takedensis]